MKKCLFFLFALGLMLYACETTTDNDPVEEGVLDGFVRLEARLQINDCEITREHPSGVVLEPVSDFINIYLDSRDGQVSIDENTNKLPVDLDGTGLFGELHEGHFIARLSKSGETFKLDFEGRRKDMTSSVTDEYSFSVSELSHTADRTEGDPSIYRHLEFELIDMYVCNALDANYNPLATAPTSTNNVLPNALNKPFYYWHSENSIRENLTNRFCTSGANLKITLLFNVDG